MTEPCFVYVEDDPMSREVFQHLLLNRLGYSQLTIFESSEDILNKIRALKAVPDVLFLDVQIQPHDGFEVLRMVKGDPSYAATRVIALTANVMASEVEELHAAGFHGLIGKPISKKDFPDLMTKILAKEPVWYVP